MAYDEQLAERVRRELGDQNAVSERQMFGGLAFMVRGHMMCGVLESDLMLRLGAERARTALQQPHVREMDFTGRPLTGMVYVAAEGLSTTDRLRRWLELAGQFVSQLPTRKLKPRPRSKKRKRVQSRKA